MVRKGRPWSLPLEDRALLVAAYWRTNLTFWARHRGHRPRRDQRPARRMGRQARHGRQSRRRRIRRPHPYPPSPPGPAPGASRPPCSPSRLRTTASSGPSRYPPGPRPQTRSTHATWPSSCARPIRRCTRESGKARRPGPASPRSDAQCQRPPRRPPRNPRPPDHPPQHDRRSATGHRNARPGAAAALATQLGMDAPIWPVWTGNSASGSKPAPSPHRLSPGSSRPWTWEGEWDAPERIPHQTGLLVRSH